MSEVPERWRNRFTPNFPMKDAMSEQLNIQLTSCIEELGTAEAKVREQAATIEKLTMALQTVDALVGHDDNAAIIWDQSEIGHIKRTIRAALGKQETKV